MIRHTAKTKFLSLFVMAFVCLNAAGAACATYCRVGGTPRLAELARRTPHHCGMADEPGIEVGQPAFEVRDHFEPCSMAVSFVGVPVEKHPVGVSDAVPVRKVNFGALRLDLVGRATFPDTFSYRGPPLLDRRVDRIKQRVLLI